MFKSIDDINKLFDNDELEYRNLIPRTYKDNTLVCSAFHTIVTICHFMDGVPQLKTNSDFIDICESVGFNIDNHSMCTTFEDGKNVIIDKNHKYAEIIFTYPHEFDRMNSVGVDYKLVEITEQKLRNKIGSIVDSFDYVYSYSISVNGIHFEITKSFKSECDSAIELMPNTTDKDGKLHYPRFTSVPNYTNKEVSDLIIDLKEGDVIELIECNLETNEEIVHVKYIAETTKSTTYLTLCDFDTYKEKETKKDSPIMKKDMKEQIQEDATGETCSVVTYFYVISVFVIGVVCGVIIS